jgi:hypothetical protein
MRVKFLALPAALLASGALHAAEVVAYRVTLQPDFAQHAVSGVMHIKVDPGGSPELRLPLHDLQISSVDADGVPLPYRTDEGQLVLNFPDGARREIRIAYHGAPQEGLNFGDNFVNSSWQGCDWMLCDEDPGKKAPLTLELLLPPGYVSLASGVPADEVRLTPDLVRHTWRETLASRPASSTMSKNMPARPPCTTTASMTMKTPCAASSQPAAACWPSCKRKPASPCRTAPIASC